MDKDRGELVAALHQPAPGVVSLAPGRPDVEVAADLKRRAEVAFGPMLELMREAQREGFLLRWDAITLDQFGRFSLIGLRLEKHF
jgi:hypothetical protein